MTDVTPERQSERKWEQNAAIPVLLRHETLDKDSYPKRDQNGAAKQDHSIEAKRSFFKEAGPGETLSADWRCVTNNVAPLVRAGGVVVDMGGNAGRYAEYLAMARKDVKVIAIEPDPDNFKMAQEEIRRAGLQNRVTLVNKPVPEALDDIRKSGARVDAITSIYRTHLQNDQQNKADMVAVGALARQTGASVLTHDMHRPQSKSTIDIMTSIYPADDATQSFRDGYGAGMRAAYRGEEMSNMLSSTIGRAGWEHRVARPLGQMQMHIMKGERAPEEGRAPKAVHPPTKEEYIGIADDMDMILKAGGLYDSIGAVPDKLEAKFVKGALGVSQALSEVFASSQARGATKKPHPAEIMAQEQPRQVFPTSTKPGSPY